MIARTEHDLFILAMVLIIVAYFVGVSTEASVFGKVLSQIGYIFAGRNPLTGQFAAYPQPAAAKAA